MHTGYIMGAMNYVTPIDQDTQRQVIERTRDFVRLSEQLFDIRLPVLPVLFDLRGRSSGMYRVRGKTREIRYNPWIFALHFDDCMETTVPHEVAHYVVDKLFGIRNVRPHGKEWKQVMQAYGADSTVTANLSLEGIPTRRTARFHYRCGCRDHQLGSIRHRKIIKREAIYSCRHCGEVLEPAQ